MIKLLWTKNTERIVRRYWGRIPTSQVLDLVNRYQRKLESRTGEFQYRANVLGVICTAQRLGLVASLDGYMQKNKRRIGVSIEYKG